MQMPQRYGAASSYGKKYALGNLFLIDDTQDADATNTHGKAKATITTADFAKAKKYVKSGGKVDAIKSKYSLTCLLYTSPSPRDRQKSRMPSSA